MELRAQMRDVGHSAQSARGSARFRQRPCTARYQRGVCFGLSLAAVQANLRQALRSRGQVPQGHVPALKLLQNWLQSNTYDVHHTAAVNFSAVATAYGQERRENVPVTKALFQVEATNISCLPRASNATRFRTGKGPADESERL